MNQGAPIPDAAAEASKLRRALLANGYEPLVLAGKVPPEKGWQSGEITEARLTKIEAMYPDHTNTGIRTGKCAAIDNDLTETAHADEIDEVISAELGDTPLRRVGSKGNVSCLYNPSPISKITISSKDGKHSKRLIEFLGVGQQFAAYGKHPDTGRDYDWPNAFFGGEPLQTPLTDLPVVSPDKLRKCAQAIRAKLSDLGYPNVTVSEAGVSSPEVSAPSQASGLPISPEILEAMLRCIPPSCDRHQWLIVCAGLLTAPVSDPDWDGLDLFIRWSRGDLHDGEPSNFKGEDDCREQWHRDMEKLHVR